MSLQIFLPGVVRLNRRRPRRLWSYGLALLVVINLLMSGWTPPVQDPAFLVKDINPVPEASDSSPSALTVVGEQLYFFAIIGRSNIDGSDEHALWKSDGTAIGTTMVKPVNVGGSKFMVDVDGTLFFTNMNEMHGWELWKSNGTAEGTLLVKDIFPGTGSALQDSQPTPLVLQGQLYFAASDGTHGLELWKSDGTAEGTVLIKDINPGASGSLLSTALVKINDWLLFYADDGAHGSELWRSDGTSEGTVLVKDINPEGTTPSSLFLYSTLYSANNTLFFGANDGVHGGELWRSDGTSEGTTLIKDINPETASSFPSFLYNTNGILFFGADDGIHGYELWRSDGTDDGTTLVKDIIPGSGSGFNFQSNEPLAINGILFFTAFFADQRLGLWKSDGTEEGTLPVKATGSGPNGSYIFSLREMRGNLYFIAKDNNNHGLEQIWRSDGTEMGTLPIIKVYSHGWRLTIFNDTLFFTGIDNSHGFELWKTDGTSEGTLMVKDLYAIAGSSYPQEFISVNDTVFFLADDKSDFNGELWKSDGSEVGTMKVKEDFLPREKVNVNGTLLLLANNGLWRSDGTANGTMLIKELKQPFSLRVVDGVVFFVNELDELWTSDGTPEGTLLLKDFNCKQGANERFPYLLDLTNVDGTLFFFTGICASVEPALWKSDGTVAGTVMITSTPQFSGSNDVVTLNGTIFFRGNSRELWKSNGTPEGTVLVETFPDPDSSGNTYTYIGWMISINGRLFFEIWQNNYIGGALWASNGSSEDTVLLKDFAGGSLFNAVDVDGTLFFIYIDVAGIRCELWKSNGTVNGTVLVKDLTAASRELIPTIISLTNVDGTLLFTANDGIHGAEPWVSDGTPAGTRMLQDIVPGAVGARPMQYFVDGSFVFFSADDGSMGRELWAMPLKSIRRSKIYLPTVMK